MEKALRHNEGKLDWTLLDFESLKPLVQVMTYGAKKYSRENWKGQLDDPMQHIQCAFRHLIAIASGEEIDPESKERHSGHVMANMMMYNFHTQKPLQTQTAMDVIKDIREGRFEGWTSIFNIDNMAAENTDVLPKNQERDNGTLLD